MAEKWDIPPMKQEDLLDYRSMCLGKAELDFYETLLRQSNCDYARYHYTYRQASEDALKSFRKMLVEREAE